MKTANKKKLLRGVIYATVATVSFILTILFISGAIESSDIKDNLGFAALAVFFFFNTFIYGSKREVAILARMAAKGSH